MKKIMEQHQKTYKEKYIVYKTVRETHNVVNVWLMYAGSMSYHFISGQYITVYFPHTGTPEGKAYSISSAPHEGMVCISVKAIGEFSHRLCSLCPGDTITGSLPYGYFYSESDANPLVLISGGIGVAPFRSMILDALEKNPVRSVYLLASFRNTSEILFKNTLFDLAHTHPNFRIYYFITREKISDSNTHTISGRMTHETLQPIISDLPVRTQAEYFLCGSIAFTRDIWRILKSLGIPEERISTEAFFSH